jgi:alanine racemase
VKPSERYATWVEVDLSAIRGNVGAFRALTGVEVIAVVKANAYGHGACEAARAALEGGATRLAVARVGEALELRQAGIESPILILGWTPPDRIAEMIQSGVSMTVWSEAQLEQASATASSLGRTALVHLKVDTGMSRIGVQPEAALPLAQLAESLADCRLEGVFTHFARADETDPAPTLEQHARFQQVLEQLAAAGITPGIVHAANSAAAIRFPDTWHDAIRTGIAIYGLMPSDECPLPEGFKPALSWKSQLVLVKMLEPGRGVSYGHTYHTTQRERIGTVPVGYADGYRRTRTNEVLIAGKRCPVIGRVTMDQIMVDLEPVPEAETGMEAVLIGNQGRESITAEHLGDRWDTINYEVTSGIAQRVIRIYT